MIAAGLYFTCNKRIFSLHCAHMRLLIVTQKVDKNDDVLGFMHRWIEEFALQCEHVTVICLYKGDYTLSSNVSVFSLGKESGQSRFKYLKNFYRIIWRKRNGYDCVLVHMNQEYVLLGALVWRLLKRKVGLWYAHGHVPVTLRIAEKLTDVIFTSTRSGFRLASSKVRVIGQGIDTNFFVPQQKRELGSNFTISVVGRISPVKDYETLIEAVALLTTDIPNLKVNIVGGVGMPEQEKYLSSLKEMVRLKNLNNIVSFLGPKANTQIVQTLQQADLFVNTSHTGSLDKAILEAMAVGVPILTCNEALKEVLGDLQSRLMFEKKNALQLREKILAIYQLTADERRKLGDELRALVVDHHSLKAFCRKIVTYYNK